MKKLMIGIIAVIAAVVTGCKSIPTNDQMYATSYSIGIATGTIANMTKIDDTSRNVVIDIVNEVETCIPQTNQTFETAWTEIAARHVQKLVDENKIDEGQATLILGTFNVAVKGIDYLINIRFPAARQYQELVESAVHGFCTGFLKVFKPANSTVSAAIIIIDPDKDSMLYNEYKTAVEYLMPYRVK